MSILAISEPAPRWPTILAASWMDEYSMPESALLLPSLTLADVGHDEAPVPGFIILLYYPNRLVMTPVRSSSKGPVTSLWASSEAM